MHLQGREMKTETDRKDQWERVAWRMSARTGEPYDQAMGVVATKAFMIYLSRLVHAVLDEVREGLGEGKATKDRFKELLDQYPFEAKPERRQP